MFFILNCQNLLSTTDNKHQSIFIEQFDDSWPGFQLRDGIKFHLYISRGPCGAASIRYGKNNIDTYVFQSIFLFNFFEKFQFDFQRKTTGKS